MRTTVTIDHRLLKRARRQAGEAGLTLSAWLVRAIQRELDVPPLADRPPFRLVTFGEGGLKAGYAWGSLDEQTSALRVDGERKR